ncbi:unnamed protein product, partial [Ectocarpus fasciculatus]
RLVSNLGSISFIFRWPFVVVSPRPPPPQATTAATAASARARLKATTTIILRVAIQTTWPASTQTPLASTMTTLLLKWRRTVNGLAISGTVTATRGTTKQNAVR